MQSLAGQKPSGQGFPGLTIAEVAAATGVPPATLRAWEERHGFPAPARLAGGRRAYSDDDVARIRRLLAERAAGATLAAAVERATRPAADEASLFAALRLGRGRLEPQIVPKRMMVALSHALEDECAARAERGVLVGAFQERRFYAPARARWRDLAAGARRAVVFADFPVTGAPPEGPVEVPIPPRAPLAREWAIVHLAPRSSVVLVGRELPGESASRDAARRFELVWSADPAPAWDAIEAAIGVAAATAPDVARSLRADVDAVPRELGFDATFMSALTNRMVGYLAR